MCSKSKCILISNKSAGVYKDHVWLRCTPIQIFKFKISVSCYVLIKRSNRFEHGLFEGGKTKEMRFDR